MRQVTAERAANILDASQILTNMGLELMEMVGRFNTGCMGNAGVIRQAELAELRGQEPTGVLNASQSA